jgi:hypothetical protein
MGLPIRDLPRQLEAEVDQWVWPGDEAVDAKASDLEQWARHGGEAGLVLRAGESPTRFELGPLSDRAFRRVMVTMQGSGDSTYLDEAFRYGVRKISGGGARIKLVLIDGIPGLDDEALDALGGCQEVIPWAHLHAELLRAMGSEVPPDLMTKTLPGPTTLPVALGMVILARTFRSRGRRP